MSSVTIESCPVLGSWPEDPAKPCGGELLTRETVLKIAPSNWWEINEDGEFIDWEDSYGPEEQESGEGLAFYCDREHTAEQIRDAVVPRKP